MRGETDRRYESTHKDYNSPGNSTGTLESRNQSRLEQFPWFEDTNKRQQEQTIITPRRHPFIHKFTKSERKSIRVPHVLLKERKQMKKKVRSVDDSEMSFGVDNRRLRERRDCRETRKRASGNETLPDDQTTDQRAYERGMKPRDRGFAGRERRRTFLGQWA